MNSPNEGRFSLTLNGAPIQDVYPSLLRVVVESSLHLPAMIEIHLADRLSTPPIPVFEHTDSVRFGIGTRVSVSASGYGGSAVVPRPLFTGTITAIEPHFNRGALRMVVRGYDALHKLHLGTNTRVYIGTEAQIVRQILTLHGIAGAPPAGMTRMHRWLLQYNTTDFNFLCWLLRRAGYYMWIDPQGMARFWKAGTPSTNLTSVEWGTDLIAFYPRASLMQQVGKVQVVGNNPQLGQNAQGALPLTPPSAAGAMLKVDYTTARTTTSGKQRVIADELATDAQAALSLASAQAMQLSSQFVEAEGECIGNPAIQPGTILTVRGVGVRFSGQYLVTSARHTWDAETGYRTYFRASIGTPEVLAALLASPVVESPKIPGLLSGVVTNNNDPSGLGRVRVSLDWLDAQCETDFCPVISPTAGSGRGMQVIPEVGDRVMLAFENGSPERPVVVGGVWNTRQPPPLRQGAVVGGKVVKRIWRSRMGHEILLDDSSGAEMIQIVDKSGKNKILIDSAQNSLNITVQGKCTIEAQQDAEIIAKQAIRLNTNGDINLECANFRVKAKAECKLEGATAQVKANGAAQMEGATLALKGNGPTSVDGTPVQINKQSLVVMP